MWGIIYPIVDWVMEVRQGHRQMQEDSELLSFTSIYPARGMYSMSTLVAYKLTLLSEKALLNLPRTFTLAVKSKQTVLS